MRTPAVLEDRSSKRLRDSISGFLDGTLRRARLVHWRIPWRAAAREGNFPCKWPFRTLVLNRVRMFDSCRGHPPFTKSCLLLTKSWPHAPFTSIYAVCLDSPARRLDLDLANGGLVDSRPQVV